MPAPGEVRCGDAEMETASGLFVDLLNPDSSKFNLADVAAHLSKLCRFGGACSPFYSVAEHACLVAWRLMEGGFDDDVVLAGLHHDDPEAYINDITRPVQGALRPGTKRELEGRVFYPLCVGLGLLHLPFENAAIKQADNWACSAEAYHLLPSRGKNWHVEGHFDPERDVVPWRLGWAPAEAENNFVFQHLNLGGRL